MEDRGGEHRRGVAFADTGHHVVQRPHPARGDHRHMHSVGDGARQGDVITGLGAVAIHGGQQDFAGAEIDHAPGELHRVDAGRPPPAMGEDLPAILALDGDLLGIDRHDDALVAEFFRRRAHEIRIGDRGRVDRDLVGAGQKQLADVAERAHAAADRQRHEALLGRAGNHVEDRLSVFGGGGDVEEAELVRTGGVIGLSRLDRIAGVDQVHEIDALDDAAVLDVQTGDDAGFEGHRTAASLLPCPSSPLRGCGRRGPSLTSRQGMIRALRVIGRPPLFFFARPRRFAAAGGVGRP